MNGIEELPNGQWVVEGDTHLGAWAKEHGSIVTDPHLFAWLKPFMEGVSVVWDIGANIGDHARQYLDWGKTVVAVEPEPLSFACLEHNCPEAMCLNVAASDADGELRFTRQENVGASMVSADGEIVVRAVALDSLELPAPGFVKIDVEGWEVTAIEGMRETLARHMPAIYVEINEGALARNGRTPDDILSLLRGIGYRDFTIYPPGCAWGDPQFDILARK